MQSVLPPSFARSLFRAFLCSILYLNWGLGTAVAAKIITTNGSVIVGEILSMTNGSYAVRTSYGIVTIPTASVQSIDAQPSSASERSLKFPLLRFAGSTTIGDELLPSLVERYAVSNGWSDMRWVSEPQLGELAFTSGRSDASFAAHLSRHGSATAFEALVDGTAEIGMSSRPINKDEIHQLASAGFGEMDTPGQEHVLALDGLVILVNRSNPLTHISITDLGAIFSGEVNDWGKIGGTPGPIHIFGRDAKSGTADTFNGIVMKGRKVTSTATLMDTSDGLSDKVASDPAAIGFAGFAYTRLAKALPILTDCGLQIEPSEFFVRTEEYPLSRRLFLYTRAPGINPDADRFVDFALGKVGQEDVAAKGFIDLAPRLSTPDYGAMRIATALEQAAQMKGDASGDLKILQVFNKVATSGRRLSVTFRFRTASFDLDSRAANDIGRLASVLGEAAFIHRDLVIVGFSDAQGPADSNVRLSQARADRIGRLLREKGITPKATIGLGRVAPVACNSSPEGLEKNRRVEIWVSDPQKR